MLFRHGSVRRLNTPGVLHRCRNVIYSQFFASPSWNFRRSDLLQDDPNLENLHLIYSEFIDVLRRSICQDWATDLAQVAFIDDASMARYSVGAGGPGKWVPLGRCKPEYVRVFQREGGQSELWVKPFPKRKKKGRYASYWRKFCKFSGVEEPYNLIGRVVVVDHVFPETAAVISDLAWVRVVAIAHEANSLTIHFEKMLARMGENPRSRTATSLTIAKISGLPHRLSSFPTGRDFAVALIDHLGALGINLNGPPELEVDLIAQSFERLRQGRGGLTRIIQEPDGSLGIAQ